MKYKKSNICRLSTYFKRLSVLMCSVFFLLSTACGKPESPEEREPAVPSQEITTAGADFNHEYTLDKTQKKMYSTIAESMKEPSEEILIYEYKGDHMDFLLNDALVAMTCYTMDNPLDSQILANCDIRMEKEDGKNKIYAYRRDNADNLDIAKLKLKDVENVSRHFISTIDSLDDEQKLRAIHDRLCQGKYDTEIDPASHTIYSALIDKNAVCDGYAYAFKYLCDLADIECIVVIGYFNKSLDGELGHAWNLVWLGDTWKLVDISCDVYDSVSGSETPTYSHFLIDDLDIDGRIPYKAYPVPMYKEFK